MAGATGDIHMRCDGCRTYATAGHLNSTCGLAQVGTIRDRVLDERYNTTRIAVIESYIRALESLVMRIGSAGYPFALKLIQV